MKSTLLLMAFAISCSGAIAQESSGLISKKGEPILPEVNDVALSIDATPIMNYMGNMLNGNLNNSSPSWGYPGTPLAITGKLFKEEKKAYRGMIRLGFGTTTTRGFSVKDAQTTSPIDTTITVEDTWKQSHSNIVVGGGVEKRRGKTRLQGFYGGMFLVGMGSSKNTYSYGNNYSSSNTNPSRTNFGSNNISGTWTTQSKSGTTFMVALRGFIGAEYFIFPKMAVGAEFGWGLGLTSTGDGSSTYQSWDSTNNSVKSSTSKTGGSTSFGIDTDVNGGQMIPTGALTLSMHF